MKLQIPSLNKGFTLVEIVIVIFIFSFIASISLLPISLLSTARLLDTESLIFQYLGRERIISISADTPREIDFSILRESLSGVDINIDVPEIDYRKVTPFVSEVTYTIHGQNLKSGSITIYSDGRIW
jgi:prepilin-type N-terminal cleavage/methylation domain-containing protein